MIRNRASCAAVVLSLVACSVYDESLLDGSASEPQAGNTGNGNGGNSSGAVPGIGGDAGRDGSGANTGGQEPSGGGSGGDCARSTFYRDADGDGFGDELSELCGIQTGYVERAGDCNDQAAHANPDAEEICDGLDDDCDGVGDRADEPACESACFGGFFNGHAYMFCARWVQRSEAAQFCSERGFRLVRIDGAPERTFLFGATLVPLYQDDFWIGARDDVVEGEWTWEDGDVFWQGRFDGAAQGGLYTNWAENQPNDLNGEDCAELSRMQSGWNDRNCSETRPFVCERY